MDIWLQDFINQKIETQECEEFAVTLCEEFANWTTKEEEDQALVSLFC